MRSMIIFFLLLFFMSCSNQPGNKQGTTDSSKTEMKDPAVAKGLELISKSDCFSCHKLTENSIGPAYSNIALKYKIINPSNMDSMVDQIQKGGSGRWSTVPMTPHPGISKEDAQMMVHYIMSIKP